MVVSVTRSPFAPEWISCQVETSALFCDDDNDFDVVPIDVGMTVLEDVFLFLALCQLLDDNRLRRLLESNFHREADEDRDMSLSVFVICDKIIDCGKNFVLKSLCI